MPIYLRMVVRHGFQRMVVERETTRWNWDKQRRLAFAADVRHAVKGLSEGIPEESKRIEVGGVNEGVPSAEETARITGEGVSAGGADPTGAKKP